ncbi:uncharacterized protein LOC125554746 [Triticum urartu]|uniref:uncharacterized protein LOC125554746 n=1 Tax=Triticum urartu TaxID=4572 RepID=UPI002044B304|nr:uncharacterized protein LOC125554746 [Triticum urartu]
MSSRTLADGFVFTKPRIELGRHVSSPLSTPLWPPHVVDVDLHHPDLSGLAELAYALYPSAARPRLPRPRAAAPPRLRPPVRAATSPDPRSPAASRYCLRRITRRHLPTSSPPSRGSLVAGRSDLEIRRRPTLPRARCAAPSGRCCWWRDCHRCEIAAVLGAASRRGRCHVEAAPTPLLLASSWPPLLPTEHGLLLAIGPPPVCQQLEEHVYMRVNPEDDMHGSLGSSILLAARASSSPE